jgi:hypothetical protein
VPLALNRSPSIERLSLWLVVAMLAAAANAQPAPPAAKADEPKGDQPSLRDDQQAVGAAKQWLERLDGGNTGPLWDNAAKSLKTKVTREKWVEGLRDMRKAFGKVDARRAVKFARSHELPGGPSGDYAIIEFETDFAGGKRAAEQVIWYLEPDGIWRVSGYFIR